MSSSPAPDDRPTTDRYNAGVACSDAPASIVPDRPAVIHESLGVSRSLTFAELAARSSGLAAMLVRTGITPGVPIGVFASAGLEATVAHIAVLKTGGITLPLVPLLGESAIRQRVADSGLELIVIAPDLMDDATRLFTGVDGAPELLELDDRAVGSGPGFEAAPTSAGDPAILLYTSGTTGPSKGAVLPHRVVLSRQVPMSMIHGPFLPDDVFWTPADWIWVGSLVDSVLGPLSHGTSVMTYERRRFDAGLAIERIKRFGVTRAFIPPTALRQLMSTTAADWRGHELRSVHSGGETLTIDAADWARDTLGVVVDEIYGLTEASMLAGNAHRYSRGAVGSMGRPFPGQEVRIAAPGGEAVDPGEPGELLVAGTSPSLFCGYHGNPGATAERFRDGWFRTGDIVRSDPAGRLFYLGRNDDLIMSAGHRIGPGEIEDALRAHDAVHDAVVVGADDAERGQRIKAVIQLDDPGAGPADDLTVTLQDLVRAQVGRHAYPRVIEYVAEFPRTVTGKVRRDQLRLEPDQRDGAAPQPAGADR